MIEKKLPEASKPAEEVTPKAAKKVRKPATKRTILKTQSASKSRSSKAPANKSAPAKQTRAKKPFPTVTLEEAVLIPQKIKELNGGNPWRPADVAKSIGRSEKTSAFFYLAAGARDYGLTDGTRDTEKISIAPIGREFVYAGNRDEERESLQKAFFNVGIFKDVYNHYKGSTLPELKYLGNTLISEFGLNSEFHEDFHRLFQENCRFIQKYGDLSDNENFSKKANQSEKEINGVITLATPTKATKLRIFVALPFSEKRGNFPKGFFSEVLNALITPAGVNAGFRVETARKEGSDIIQATIVNDLLNSDLVVADLTDHNPNVLFELGMRMAFDKPVALIRAEGTGPIFDVDSMLRVWEYSPNLWRSSLESDIPALTLHIKGAWEARNSAKSYLTLLKEQ
ncbi:hypothetical protein [Janthinobacterium sp. PAMC25594]|uniref:hypothetical protein n=1 Tax=Janthinobacterium sp. PAMC25594 TaxID=2861284 RepID=UPI001C62D12D|nr:hypothetical protein [Janthinobacterium sp. PAMC25594]QYG05988.1 hypothetical protein KY494_22255 [Janthinobacterium sp. PAMC25594]